MNEETHRHEVTRLIQAASASDHGSADQLLTLVYDQLRKIAQQRMNEERRDHTLQATALVHEAYLRMVGDQPLPWANRAHFFTAAAEAMRKILIEHARTHGRIKRGGGRRRVPLNVLDLAAAGDSEGILSVDEAIQRLESQDPEVAAVVRLRYFAGLSESEVAQILNTSDRTVRRAWSLARAWLARELGDGETG